MLVKDKFDRPCLKKLHGYLQSTLCRWISSLVPSFNEQKWSGEIESYLYCEFVRLRTSEMFSLFQDFPDSLPAINDFKEALDKTKLHNYFTT